MLTVRTDSGWLWLPARMQSSRNSSMQQYHEVLVSSNVALTLGT